MSLSSRFLAGVGRCTRLCTVPKSAWISGEGAGVRNLRVGHPIITKPFSDVFSAEPSPPPDRIQPLLAMIWSHSPNTTVPFSLYCKIPGDRWRVRGLRIISRRKRPLKVVLVSGTRGQDPSTIGVNMCVAAALSRGGIPLVDVSVVPVAYPREYERVWKSEKGYAAIKDHLLTNLHSSSIQSPDLHNFDVIASKEQIPEVNLQGLVENNEDDVCSGPLKNYLARLGGFYVNLDLDITRPGGDLVFKGSKFPKFTDSMKFQPKNDSSENESPMPMSMCLGDQFGFLDPILQSPTYVIHLRNSRQIDDEELESCAEDVLKAIHKLEIDSSVKR